MNDMLRKVARLVAGLWVLWSKASKDTERMAVEKVSSGGTRRHRCGWLKTAEWGCLRCGETGKPMEMAGRSCAGRTKWTLEERIRRMGHGVGKAVVVDKGARLWFCDKCGKYSGGRLTGLMKERCRVALTSAGKRAIRRLMNGKHPDGKGDKVDTNPSWEIWKKAGIG